MTTTLSSCEVTADETMNSIQDTPTDPENAHFVINTPNHELTN